MKILITGAGGMLGTDLACTLQVRFDVHGLGRREALHLAVPYSECDLANRDPLFELVEKQKPDLIFHCAAMTHVDGCEIDRDRAWRDNVEVTKNVTDAANQIRATLIFFSTDYIFDGTKAGEYEENDMPHPLNVYGETKYQAEKYIQEKGRQFLIFRISWLYGLSGKSFPRTILEKARAGQTLKIVSDQVGRPTFSRDIADTFAQLLIRDERAFEKNSRNIFHLANEGKTSWAHFARTVLDKAGYSDVKIESISSQDLDRPAKRPLNSTMSLEKTGRLLGIRMRPWEEAVGDFVRKMKDEE